MTEEKDLIEKARNSDTPVCHKCGEPMSKNPRPEAGKPHAICHVGTVWECIPCLVLNRHVWARRAWKAEKENAELRESLLYILQLCGTEKEDEFHHTLHVDIPEVCQKTLDNHFRDE
jgi:hypothetical protein